MAKYVDLKSLRSDGQYKNLGFIIIPTYGRAKFDPDHLRQVEKWIEENIIGEWYTFRFGIPCDGQSYCFKNQADVISFKLRWV